MAVDESGMKHVFGLEVEVEHSFVCRRLEVFNIDAWLKL